MLKRCKFVVMIIIVTFTLLSVPIIAQNQQSNGISLSDEDTLIQQANSLYEQGKLNEALAAYRAIEKKYPKNMLAYYNEGNALKGLGKYNEAIDAYNKALLINSNSIAVLYEQGDAYEKLNNKKEAAAWYTKATNLNPSSATGYFKRGSAYEKLGNAELAKKDYLMASELDPKYEYLADKYSNNKDTTKDQDSDNQEETATQSISEVINNNKTLIILLLLVIMLDCILIIFKYRKKSKNNLVIRDTLNLIQGKLGLYTYNYDLEDKEQVIDKTMKLISTWESNRVKESLDKLKAEYDKLDSEITNEVIGILEKELELRVFD